MLRRHVEWARKVGCIERVHKGQHIEGGAQGGHMLRERVRGDALRGAQGATR